MQIETNPLKGRTALITGCGSETGIGFATANLLLSRGTRVAITSTTNRINKRQAAIDPSGQRVRAYVADLTDRPQVESLVERVMADFGYLDILVNNAGMAKLGDAEIFARRHQRRFIDQVSQLSPGKARRTARNDAQIDIGTQRCLARVYAQNLLAAFDVGVADGHLAVSARFGEHIGAPRADIVGRMFAPQRRQARATCRVPRAFVR